MDAHRRRLTPPPGSASRWPAEVNAALRDHVFYPDGTMPAFGDRNRGPARSLRVHARYFAGAASWWVVTADPESGDAQGFACADAARGPAVWGVFSLLSLERARVGGDVVVQRDLAWTPAVAGEIPILGDALG